MEDAFLIIMSALGLALLACVCAMLLLGAIKDEMDRRFEEHTAMKKERGSEALFWQRGLGEPRIADELGILREEAGALQDRLYKRHGEDGIIAELGWVQECLLHAIEQRRAKEA